MNTSALIFALATLTFAAFANAFTAAPTFASTRSVDTSLGMTILNYKGKKVNAKEGSPLKNVVGKLGIKPKYSCKKGECNSCVISVGGRRLKPCVDKVPPMPNLKSLQEKGLEVK